MDCLMEKNAIKFNGKKMEKPFRGFGYDYALSELIVHMKQSLAFHVIY